MHARPEVWTRLDTEPVLDSETKQTNSQADTTADRGPAETGSIQTDGVQGSLCVLTTPKWSCSFEAVQGTGSYRRLSLSVTTELCVTHGGPYLAHALIFLTSACSLCMSA